jgi:hypothetical protein
MLRGWLREASMNAVTPLISDIRALRPFLPAKDFEMSLDFYKTLGFEARPLSDTLAALNLGTHGFLLQGHYVKGWADNMLMHVLVSDVNAWWRHIDSLQLTERYPVSAPIAPRAEAWGLTVAYVFDPCGVLWHFAQDTKWDA